MSSASNVRRAVGATQPWWTLLIGLVLWMLILLLFSRILATKDEAPATQAPLDAQLVELPAARAPASAQPKQMPPQAKRVPAKASPPNPVADHAPSTAVTKTQTAPVTAPVSKPTPPVVTSAPGTAQMGAKAIYQPLPKIPDELRDQAIKAAAMARFHIKPDGSVTVELLKATSDPRINQIILNTLKTWKFFPAMQNGKPVQSTQDIKVDIDIS